MLSECGKHEDRAAMEDGFLASLSIPWSYTLEWHWHTLCHPVPWLPEPAVSLFQCKSLTI